jgi:PEP-CTERM motif-containing protein
LHEIDHVLGHFSGLGDGYATAFDLFRCSNGAPSFSSSAASYFAIDGCKTNLANFNTTGSGDRDDWASSPSSTDVQGAFLYPGIQYGISAADITALDVIGWGAKTTGGFSLSLAQLGSVSKAVDAAAIPEPSTLALVVLGMIGFWLVRRRRSA